MKIILGIAVAVCTFVVGCATFFLLPPLIEAILLDPSLRSVDIDRDCFGRVYPGALPSSSEPPILDYCEVATNPECYSGKLLLIKAHMSGDNHGIFFYGPGCETQRTAGALTGMSNDEYDEVVRKTCKEPCDYLEVEVLGRFEYIIHPNHTTNLNWDTMPMHLELLRVREASKSR